MIFKVFIALASILFQFCSFHSCHCAFGVFFPPDKHTLRCLKTDCTIVLWNTSGCLLQIFYFLYYWVRGYCVTGLQKQAGDEYQGVHDFSLQGNTMLKCDFLLVKQMLHASVEFSKGNYKVFKGKLQSNFGTSHAYTVILKIVAWVSSMDVQILSQISVLMELKYCRGKCYLIWSMCLRLYPL